MTKFFKGFLCAAFLGTAASFTELWCKNVPDRPAGAIQLIDNEVARAGEPTSWRLLPAGVCFGTAGVCCAAIYGSELLESTKWMGHRLMHSTRRSHG